MTTRQQLLITLLAVFALLAAPQTLAADEDSVGFSCQLLDSNADPIVGANVTVSIYDAASGGNQVHTETFNNATNSNGACTFNTLGNDTGVNLTEGQQYYTDLTVNGNDYDFNGAERQAFIAWFGQNKQVSGTVTANSFVGSGSGLTGVVTGTGNAGDEVNLGTSSSASNDAIAIGASSSASDTLFIGGGVAIGESTSSDSAGVSIGPSATAARQGISIGRSATTGQQGIAIGDQTNADVSKAIAIGFLADATSSGIALGYSSQADGVNSLAIGDSVIASAQNAYSLGQGINNSQADSLIYGVSGSTYFRVNSTGVYDQSGNQLATDLNTLSDVTLTSAADGEILVYNSTSSQWENQAQSSGGSSFDPNGTGTDSLAIGNSALANQSGTNAYGNNTQATEPNAIAIGNGAAASGFFSTSFRGDTLAIGNAAQATNYKATVIGPLASSAGYFSVTIGPDASASNYGVAIGDTANATANSVAVGRQALANANAVAVGLGSNAGTSSTSTGVNSDASGEAASAFGTTATADSLRSTAIGTGATADNTSGTAGFAGEYQTALGALADATDHETTAVGGTAEASGLGATALGFDATAQGIYSLALGYDNVVSGDYSTYIGYRNATSGTGTVSGDNSFAAGQEIQITGSDTVVFGRDASESLNQQFVWSPGTEILRVNDTGVYHKGVAVGGGSVGTDDIGDNEINYSQVTLNDFTNDANYLTETGDGSSLSGVVTGSGDVGSSVALGNSVFASSGQIVIGEFSTASSANSITIGTGSDGSATSTITLGQGMFNNVDNNLLIGMGGTQWLRANSTAVMDGQDNKLATENYVDANAGADETANYNWTGDHRFSQPINHTQTGTIRTFANGCVETANATGVFITC